MVNFMSQYLHHPLATFTAASNNFIYHFCGLRRRTPVQLLPYPYDSALPLGSHVEADSTKRR